MIHFLGEIILLILFTALLWFGIGWWVSNLERNKTLRTREEEWRHYLNTLRRDRDAFRDEVEKAHGRIRVLENRRADGQSPPRGSELTEDERKQYEKNISALQSKFESTERKMLGFSQHVESLHQQNQQRENALTQFKKRIEDLTSTLHQREELLEQLNAGAADQVNNTQGIVQDLREQLLAKDSFIAQLEAASHSAAEQEQHLAALAESAREKDDEIARLQGLLDETAQAGPAQSRQVVALQKLVGEQEQTITQLRAQMVSPEAARMSEELQDMRDAMTEQEAIISQLRLVLDKATRLTGQQGGQRPRRSSPASPAAPQSGDLFAQIGATDETPAAPEAEDHSRQEHDEPLQSRPGEQATTHTPSASVPAPEQPTLSVQIYAQAPANADNLKKISGIGPTFEKMLNRLGIFKFAQVAALNQADIELVAGEMNSFPERIVRDQWVEQALALQGSSQT